MNSSNNNPDHPHASYNRPNAKWSCGHSDEGCPTCPLGPSRQGKCRASGQCRPQLRDDRYYCTRSKALGGPCSEGPLPDGSCANIIPPCNPKLSTRALRGRVCLVIAILSAALLIFLFNSPSHEQYLSAGPLSRHHATAATSCMDCHTTDVPGTVLPGKLLDLHARSLANAQKCLDCHNLGDAPLQAHGLAQSELQALTKKHASSDKSGDPGVILQLAGKLVTASQSEDGTLACASCHTEHKGPGFELKAMSNAQCQTCHQTQFHEFTDDHPAFENYPYSRRTRIIFDHETHLIDHFKKPAYQEMAATDCLSCHQVDDAGKFMQVRSFEQSCAACHGDQIEGEGRAGALGIATLQIPGIDTYTLRKRGYPIGEWPEYADGKLTPFMRAILRQSPESAQYLDALSGIDLMNLEAASEAQIESANKLLWSVKELFFEALTSDQQYIRQQILTGTLEPTSAEARQGLSAQLPFDVLHAAQQAWFPNLLLEVPQYRNGQFAKVTPDASAQADPPAELNTPAGALEEAGSNLLLSEESEGDTLLGNDSSDEALVSEDSELLTANADSGDLLDMNASEDSGLLASNTGESELLEANEADDGGLLMANESSGGGDLLLAGGDSGDGLLSGVDSSASNALATNDAPEPAPVQAAELKDPEVWSSNGGWYRSDTRYVLYYRPSGHADHFITNWVNATAPVAHEDESAKFVLDQLTADKAPGLCMKCHSIDQSPSGQHQVNWVAESPDPYQSKFTRFSHASHFIRNDGTGCMQCHKLEAGSHYADSFHENHDPRKFSGNFSNMDKSLCADCHNEPNATNQCLLCHNYHVGEQSPKQPPATLEAFLKSSLEAASKAK